LGAVFASPKTLTNAAAGDETPGARLARGRTANIMTSSWRPSRTARAGINEQTKPLLENHRQIHQSAGRAGWSANCAYIDPDGKTRRQERRQPDQLAAGRQGFVDKGFAVDAIIAKEYVKAD